MGVDSETIPSLSQFFEGLWHEKTGLASGLLTGLVVTEGLLVTGGAVWWLNLSIATVVMLCIWLAWRWSGLPPKTQTDRVGFLVCITSDDDVESKRLRHDFIIPLQKLIRSGNSGSAIQFLELPSHLAKKVIEAEDAERMRVACKAHFMIFGQIRRRTIDGKETHVVDLDGIVTHTPIPHHVSQRLATEFGELLPRKVHISTENDLLSFHFTSEWTDIVAKYIIGIAAALSGDIKYAESLFTDAQVRLKTKDTKFPVYKKLSDRLPARIAELHEARAYAAYDVWQKDHDESHFDEIQLHIQRVVATGAALQPRMYFLMAIHAFLHHRDIVSALEFLRKVKDPNSALWHFNMAFLNGYTGNLKSASQHYREASLHDFTSDLLSQVEDFMCWTLTVEPKKYQLSYCLGLFNWRAKGDTAQACKDFEVFLQSGSANEFIKERELSKQWIQKLVENSGKSDTRLSGDTKKSD